MPPPRGRAVLDHIDPSDRQSGERFVGKDTFRAMRQGALPLEFKTWRILGEGSIWTAEKLMRVAGGENQLTLNVLEFLGDKVAREIVASPSGSIPRRIEGNGLSVRALSCLS
jgi:hypothetical protein